jgi:hypothetical protein
MKIKKMFNKWQLLAVTIILLLSALVTSALPVLASSPPNPMLNNYLKVGSVYGPAGVNTNYYVDLIINGGPAQPGWCVDYVNTVIAGHTYYPANIYDYFGQYYPDYTSNLPLPIQAVNWFAVTYVLNHKVGNWEDVQNALWYFTDGIPYASGSNTETMVNDTISYLSSNGGIYIPGEGDIAPMVCYIRGAQLLVFEYTVTDPSEPLPEQPTALLFGLGLLGIGGFIMIKRHTKAVAVK